MTKTPRNCFLAMFDVVGFKTLRGQKETSGLYKLYKGTLLPAIQHSAAGRSRAIESNERQLLVPDFHADSLIHRFMSDTLILFGKDDQFEQFMQLLLASHRMLEFGFCGLKAPLRGAIGFGDIIADENGIIVGSAMEDAYRGESSQMWAGCMLTDAAEKELERRGYFQQFRDHWTLAAERAEDERRERDARQNGNILVRYDVPTQRNPRDGPIEYRTRNALVLDWTIRMYKGAAEKSFFPADDPHASQIQANTIAFEGWARRREAPRHEGNS